MFHPKSSTLRLLSFYALNTVLPPTELIVFHLIYNSVKLSCLEIKSAKLSQIRSLNLLSFKCKHFSLLLDCKLIKSWLHVLSPMLFLLSFKIWSLFVESC